LVSASKKRPAGRSVSGGPRAGRPTSRPTSAAPPPSGWTCSPGIRAHGAIVARTARHYGRTATTNLSTRYAHDAGGNLVSATDAAGHTTSYEFDALGRMTA
jgi:YD repeat-containing protein